MSEELDDTMKPETPEPPKTVETIGNNLEPNQVSIPGQETKLSKQPGRFGRFLKRVLIVLLVLLVVFGGGWLASWQVQYQPMAEKWKETDSKLQTTQLKVTELENELKGLKDVEIENQTVQESLSRSKMHIVLLRILADLYAAQLALADEDPANAQLYLDPIPERLNELGDFLGSEHADVISNMQQRLDLVNAEITNDPATAQMDLSLIVNNIQQIESVYFSVP